MPEENAPDNATVVYVGSDAQPLQDQIKFGGRPLDLTLASSVALKMRYAESANLKIASGVAAVDDAVNGRVSYDWTDTDLNEEGEYYAWWNVTMPDGDLDAGEFLVIVGEHSPGIRTTTGAIARAARAIIPVTWYALERTNKYGDSLLQDKIEVVKMRVFNSVISVANEATYDVRVINFLAKLAVLEIIPGAVDYWMDQHITVTTTGTSEMVSYPDRIAALWKIYERLVGEIADEKPVIEDILDIPELAKLYQTPVFSEGKEFMTPLPSKFFDYSFPDTTNIPW